MALLLMNQGLFDVSQDNLSVESKENHTSFNLTFFPPKIIFQIRFMLPVSFVQPGCVPKGSCVIHGVFCMDNYREGVSSQYLTHFF